MLPYADAEEDISLEREKTGYVMDGDGKCGSDTNASGPAGVACCNQDREAFMSTLQPHICDTFAVNSRGY